MLNNLKTTWTIIGFFWAATVILTYWNVNKIDSIEKIREKKEIYLRDEQFWNNNVKNISQILKKCESLIQNVESSKLGLFELESNLRSLARKIDLNTFNIITESQFDQKEIIPIRISFQSTFKKAVKWLDLLEEGLPFVRIRNVKIEVDRSFKQAKFEVSINYRYHIASK